MHGYDPSMPQMIQVRKDGDMAPGIPAFMDDGRITGSLTLFAKGQLIGSAPKLIQLVNRMQVGSAGTCPAHLVLGLEKCFGQMSPTLAKESSRRNGESTTRLFLT